jgi:hypothetical protein
MWPAVVVPNVLAQDAFGVAIVERRSCTGLA